MKNKGFTLLELLGVIIILAILVTLSFPSIINFIKSSTEKKDKIINDLIVSAAESYINDNSDNLYITSGSNYCITVDELVETQYLNSIMELKKYPKDTKSVKVTYNNGYSYEVVDSKSCFVCNLISDSDGSNDISIGDKYQCKVKDNMEPGFEKGYYFYVLSFNENGTTNLIMDRNICDNGTVATEDNTCLVSWASKDDYNDDDTYGNFGNNHKGPITVMKYLYNATKNWDNVSNIVVNYNDENKSHHSETNGADGYGSIKTVGNRITITNKIGEETVSFENLKARLPMYDEVYGENKCKKDNDMTCSVCGSCPYWLSNHLKKFSPTTATQYIDTILGYWLLTSYNGSYEYYSSDAWHVYYTGIIVDSRVSAKMGARPVITVSNGLILN